MNKNKTHWFSLIEIMIGILIVSIVMISAFYALSAANIWKVRLTQKWDIDREAFYFQEDIVENLKQAGSIDYEEYFNRMVVENSAPQYHSGHYLRDSLFWNTSNPFYYCRSKSWIAMWTWGCVSDFNASFTWAAPNINHSGQSQLYGEYGLMAIDYNSDASSDLWDQNGDGTIVWDDDDAYLWDVPSVFPANGKVDELYFVSGNKKKRTFLRWDVKKDPNAPASAPCNWLGWNPSLISWNGCLWTLEMLKLEWVDWGNDHDISVQDATQFDGKIDTWIYDRQYYGLSTPIVASGSNDQYWVPLFSNDINVESADFFLFPNKDHALDWKDASPWENIAPFLKLHLVLTPSYRRLRWVSWPVPQYTLSTTVNLTWVLSNSD